MLVIHICKRAINLNLIKALQLAIGNKQPKFNIFSNFRAPSSDNSYVFNGDLATKETGI